MKKVFDNFPLLNNKWMLGKIHNRQHAAAITTDKRMAIIMPLEECPGKSLCMDETAMEILFHQARDAGFNWALTSPEERKLTKADAYMVSDITLLEIRDSRQEHIQIHDRVGRFTVTFDTRPFLYILRIAQSTGLEHCYLEAMNASHIILRVGSVVIISTSVNDATRFFEMEVWNG